MKKRFIYNFIAVMAVVLVISSANAFADTKNVSVSLPFKVILNGSEINNSCIKNLLIVYKDITYFSMTFGGYRYLGLETKWDQKEGLEINKTNISCHLDEFKINQKNLTKYTYESQV